MSITGMMVCIFLVIVGGIPVVWPLLRDSEQGQARLIAHKQRERLMVYYEQVVSSIRDLDEDFAAGKLPAESYLEDRQRWADRGVVVLETLNELNQNDKLLKTDSRHLLETAIDDAIETAIAEYAQARSQA
ncbi:MAG: hypothetical protein OHK0046_33920 [Anaerolineae bacterium]